MLVTRTKQHAQGVCNLSTPLDKIAMFDRALEVKDSNLRRATDLQLILAQIEEEMLEMRNRKLGVFSR